MAFRLGGLETGGTTFKLSLALGTPTNVLEQYSIPTTTPEETLEIVAQQFHRWNIDCIGIASFGPIDPNPSSPTYGFITTTPKPGWQNTNVLGILREKLLSQVTQDQSLDQTLKQERVDKFTNLKFGWNTDVNAAASVELLYGENNDVNSLVYITIGTGIGIGIAIDLNNAGSASQTALSSPRNVFMLTNMLHPEGGHVLAQKCPNDPLERGTCPFHPNCIEGFANNHSTAQRIGLTHDQLPTVDDENDAWKCTAHYIAQLCVNLIYIVSPQRIIIGGGLSHRAAVMDYVRDFIPQLNNGYVVTNELKDMHKFIQKSKFDQPGSITSPGAVGALWLAFNTSPNQ